jgi:hypothetical protein
MRQEVGDLWTYPADYRCITTNGVVNRDSLVMGAGVALQAKERFPHLPRMLAGWVNQYGNRPFLCRKEGLITFPTKKHWRERSDIELIVRSARLVVDIVDKYDIRSVVLTRPGCGNGGLRWEDVLPFLEVIFDDRFTVVSKN